MQSHWRQPADFYDCIVILTINLPSQTTGRPASILTRSYVAHARNWLNLDYHGRDYGLLHKLVHSGDRSRCAELVQSWRPVTEWRVSRWSALHAAVVTSTCCSVHRSSSVRAWFFTPRRQLKPNLRPQCTTRHSTVCFDVQWRGTTNCYQVLLTLYTRLLGLQNRNVFTVTPVSCRSAFTISFTSCRL